MSRFVNRTVTRDVDLGPCDCPGTPHERDVAVIRGELSAQEIADFVNAPDGPETAEEAAKFIKSWNLLGPDGTHVEPSKDALLDLFQPTLTLLLKGVLEVVNESARRGMPPNGSSAPSPSGSRGSGSRRQTATPSETS